MSPVVLLVDDDDSCAILLRAAMQKVQVNYSLQYVSDGRDAMDYLSGIGKYQDREKYPTPSLVLLDLNMPSVNGFDVLRWKGRQRWLDGMPCVVWSTADREADQQQAAVLGADAFLGKPMKLEGLMSVARELVQVMARSSCTFNIPGNCRQEKRFA